jgi:hypothetical protein
MNSFEWNQLWPGKLKPAPKRARLATLSAPSGRSGRVQIHLYLE